MSRVKAMSAVERIESLISPLSSRQVKNLK